MQKYENILEQPLFVINNITVTAMDMILNILSPVFGVLIMALLLRWITGVFVQRWGTITIKQKNAKRMLSNGHTSVEAQPANVEEQIVKVKKRIRNIIVLFAMVSIIIIVLRYVLVILALRNIFTVFSTPFYVSNNTRISFLTLIQLIVLLYLANFISVTLRKILDGILAKRLKLRVKSTMISLIRYGVLVCVIFIGLPFVGIDIGSLKIVLGALGFGLGFGLQDLIANFFAGITISMSQIISEKDRVILDGIEGEVQRINMLNTVVRSITSEELIIPNKQIVSQSIQNLSHTDSLIIIGTTIQVSYRTDLHQVKGIMEEAATKLPWCTKPAEPFFRVQSFDASGISVAVYIEIREVKDRYAARSELNMNVWELFKTHNIEIPFPQLDIHMKYPAPNTTVPHPSG